MKDRPVIIGGEYTEEVYGDYAEDAQIIANELLDILIKGDNKGVPFAYPLITVNVSKAEDLDTEIGDKVCELSAKNGNPYFANFMKSSLSSDDTYSLCCRLRLNKREILKKQGLFGGQPSTGSVGVVTLSLPKIAQEADGDVEKFHNRMLELMEVAKDVLGIKRAEITKMFEANVYPMLKASLPKGFDTFFNTIGYVGFHEACLELFDKPITECKEFVQKTFDLMVEKTQDFQEETGDLFNVEASPAESAAYSLALKMGDKYPYFTNSCHIPVGKLNNLKEAAEFYDDLLSKNTGGSVWHVFNEQATHKNAVKSMIKTLFSISDVPYVSFTPSYYVCPEHGLLDKGVTKCPVCGEEGVKYTRVTGYVRPVSNFNKGKRMEEEERFTFNL
jgi:ribonucleoside-triphosphate reductase